MDKQLLIGFRFCMGLSHVCCQHVLNMYLLFDLSDQLIMID